MARFLQLTDLHVVAPGILASGVLDTRTILTKAIDRLLTLLPSFRPLDYRARMHVVLSTLPPGGRLQWLDGTTSAPVLSTAKQPVP